MEWFAILGQRFGPAYRGKRQAAGAQQWVFHCTGSPARILGLFRADLPGIPVLTAMIATTFCFISIAYADWIHWLTALNETPLASWKGQ
ncbi:hypothetical protein [Chitiniphilus eburneus]|uniref:Uncharacterized protein n=1 Tax=Chitiniphilus eburneus TaxID=2571148 RepID=A0A4U0PAI4_9NEIS|nr:hypothetical protein [Chitiniphilus eburneus]TJZ64480.1 hypothetical protein FAZ21_19130 [Chitiniphilus eburneus]